MFRFALMCLGMSVGSVLTARLLIHYFQLESYQFPGYFRTVRRNWLKACVPGACLSAVAFISVIFIQSMNGIHLLSALILCLVLMLAGWVIGKYSDPRKAKKALAFTPRMKRLHASLFTFFFLILFFAGQIEKESAVFRYFFACFPLLLPMWAAVGGLLAWPGEKIISELYFRDAQRILRERKDLIKIGITGSWGKTSVKFILGTMLEEKYHTLITPSSYNTPMGVTKVIRSSLEPGHRVFVAEMGARHVGDIKEMCRLVHPEYGVLTSVGPQHLDTFKTIERIKKTKYELIEALPDTGCSFFADDDGICLELYEKTEKDKMLAGGNSRRDDIWAEEISISEKGSSFFLCTRDMRILCTTALLGELNIRNIVLCAAVCMKLGMNGRQIARGISRIKPVEHRLQLINNPGGITVIDDAFNSNLTGAKEAFRILSGMNGNRILVTPGMVELGNAEEKMNRELGLNASACCDTVILVGKKRTAAIREGLQEGGFPSERIHVTASLEEASALLASLARQGDTVLFENDLPDNYTE